VAKARVLIVGAGIGGLTAALALIRRGYAIQVFEQAPELTELGAGVQISPNGSRILRALGLGDELARIGIEPGIVDLRLWNTGARWKMMEHGANTRERYGSPHYTIHRADLQTMLKAAVLRAAPSSICVNSRCVGIAQSVRGVALTLEGGLCVTGDVLIGADGIHSTVRQALFGRDTPEFTGFMAWRGLCPAAKLQPALMRHGGWIAPASHIFHYPVRNRELLNVIAVVERRDWRHESWTDRGTHEEWLGDFPGRHEDARAMIAAVETTYKWALVVRWPLPRWSVANATLLGDACHSTLPFLAQGAAMSIEDACILARCLDACDDIETALQRYEAARIDRTRRIVLAAVAQKDRLHGDSLKDPNTAKRHVDEKWSAASVEELYDGIYGYDALNVTI